MDDRIADLLAQYELDVYRAGRVKGAWMLETNQGLKSLGSCSYSEGKRRYEQKVKQPVSAKKTAPKKVAPTKEVIAESAETKLESKTEKPVSEVKPKTAPKKVAPTKVPASKPDSAKDVKVETKTSEAKPKTAPKKVAPVKATEPKTEEVKAEAKAETPKKVAPPKND